MDEKCISTFLHHELIQMPPQHLIFLHSSQQHVISHFLHALIAVRYQTEASGIFSSSQKDDFSATRVQVLKLYSTPGPDTSKWQKKTQARAHWHLPYSYLNNNNLSVQHIVTSMCIQNFKLNI
jgi:hypothetical protein